MRTSGGSPHSALCDSDKCPCYQEGARYDESWIDDDLYREAPDDLVRHVCVPGCGGGTPYLWEQREEGGPDRA
jgi:hypothetical protein